MPRVAAITRQTVDLDAWPDLVVIYLGMKAKSVRGLGAIARLGPQISSAVAEKPDGLLLHENMLFSLLPLHVGMRQYWRDLDSLERWTREGWHRGWWTGFLRDPDGTAFWHETYRRGGGFEAIYDNLDVPTGLMRFAPAVRARGPMFSARGRLGEAGAGPAPPVAESALE